MSIYEMILANAPKRIHRVAGDLHEAIWEELLRAEDPSFHNVRLTRGDGGIDGIVFCDPKYGGNTIFQAKFFKDINTTSHKKAVIKSFVEAHKHAFECNQWILLIPFDMSHKELSWLMGTMKIEAKKQLPKSIHRHKIVDSCRILYKDESQMLTMLRNNLDIAYRHLPRSALALEKIVEIERERADKLEKEIADRLREIQKEAIRNREVETRRAVAFLKILNQGWANYLGMLEHGLITVRRSQPNGTEKASFEIEEFAKGLEIFTRQKIDEASATEGLVNGISDLVAGILINSRQLTFVAINYQDETNWPDTVDKAMRDIKSNINDLKIRIGKVLINL